MASGFLLAPCPDCGKQRVPVQWCPECGLTTHPELVRLRAECERLRAGNKVLMSHDDTIRASQAKRKRLEARVRELEAALRPFAVVADYLPDGLPAETVALTTPDEFCPWDIRAKYVYGARAALETP